VNKQIRLNAESKFCMYRLKRMARYYD